MRSSKKGNNHLVFSNHIHTTFLYNYEIKPCTDCRTGKKDKKVCVVKDGMNELYSRIDAADILVIGTPIYWFGPSAQTKLYLDRFPPYYGIRRLTGKKAILLLPAGTGEKDYVMKIVEY